MVAMTPRTLHNYMRFRRAGLPPRLAFRQAQTLKATATTVTEFCLDYKVTISARRVLDFRLIQLEPHQLLSHSMFGESKHAITDGVHAIVVFPTGVKEVIHANLVLRSPRPDVADKTTHLPSRRETSTTRLAKSILEFL